MTSWADDYRQNWIAETLRVFGFINRVHLMRKFDISTPQAANDFARFMRERPGAMTYDKSRKCYIGVGNADKQRNGGADDHAIHHADF
jgi:hypothetical protein